MMVIDEGLRSVVYEDFPDIDGRSMPISAVRVTLANRMEVLKHLVDPKVEKFPSGFTRSELANAIGEAEQRNYNMKGLQDLSDPVSTVLCILPEEQKKLGIEDTKTDMLAFGGGTRILFPVVLKKQLLIFCPAICAVNWSLYYFASEESQLL